MENVIANHCNGVMFFDSLKLCSILAKNAKRYAWLIFHCLVSLWWKHHIFGLKRCAAFAEMGKKGQLWMDKLEQIYRAECPITIPDPIIWSFLLYLKSTWCLGRVDSLQMNVFCIHSPEQPSCQERIFGSELNSFAICSLVMGKTLGETNAYIHFHF